jgi:hypothetical protein
MGQSISSDKGAAANVELFRPPGIVFVIPRPKLARPSARLEQAGAPRWELL